MSRWLKSLDQVSNLIEKLDGRVATAAEERSGYDVADDLSGIGEILSKRWMEDSMENEEDNAQALEHSQDQNIADESDNKEDMRHVQKKSDQESCGDKEDHEEQPSQYSSSEVLPVESGEHLSAPSRGQETFTPNTKAPSSLPHMTDPNQKGAKPAKGLPMVTASNETQKEVRALRKHVVRLNSTLEQAENEIIALRRELEQAAERMDKDRAKAKAERETAQNQKNEELKAAQEEKERALNEQKARSEKLIGTFKETIADLEKTRMQEGGSWSKELAQALERELAMSTRVNALEVCILSKEGLR